MDITRAQITEEGLKIRYDDGSWVKVNGDMIREKTPGAPVERRALEEGERDALLEALAAFEAGFGLDEKEVRRISVEADEVVIVYADGTREQIEDDVYMLRDGETGARLHRPATAEDVSRFDTLIEENPDLVREDDPRDEPADEDADEDDPEVVVRGGEDDDDLDGSGDAELVRGGDGDDTMDGRGGDDDMRGGQGNDDMDGGRGNDELLGATGMTPSMAAMARISFPAARAWTSFPAAMAATVWTAARAMTRSRAVGARTGWKMAPARM